MKLRGCVQDQAVKGMLLFLAVFEEYIKVLAAIRNLDILKNIEYQRFRFVSLLTTVA